MALNAGIAKNTDANDARSDLAATATNAARSGMAATATNDVLLLNSDVLLNANKKLQRSRSR